MCLAKAYFDKSGDNPIMQDIALMRLVSDRVELETLFGEKKAITGRVIEIDFSSSRILLNETVKVDRD